MCGSKSANGASKSSAMLIGLDLATMLQTQGQDDDEQQG